MSNWRDDFGPDGAFRQKVEARVRERLLEGRAKGLSKYGGKFVGDPIQNAFEEACDLAFYLATELERRETEK